MKRLAEKLADGRNVLKENYAYVTNPKHGSFIEGKAVDKLAEYEQAEEDGVLKKFLCNIGGIIYCPLKSEKKKLFEFEIVKIEIYKDEILYIDDGGNVWEVDDFGKTVFLTKTEAEQALAKMKGV